MKYSIQSNNRLLQSYIAFMQFRNELGIRESAVLVMLFLKAENVSEFNSAFLMKKAGLGKSNASRVCNDLQGIGFISGGDDQHAGKKTSKADPDKRTSLYKINKHSAAWKKLKELEEKALQLAP
jgi:hypothetical protein